MSEEFEQKIFTPNDLHYSSIIDLPKAVKEAGYQILQIILDPQQGRPEHILYNTYGYIVVAQRPVKYDPYPPPLTVPWTK